MRALFVFQLFAWMVLPLAGRAQDDTAHHRAVYAEINDREKSLKKVKAIHQDDELTFALEGWFDGQTLRKIVATVPGEDGDGSEEYYLEKGQPLFVYRTYSTIQQETGKVTARFADRFYFKNGNLFKWLRTDKKLEAPASNDFRWEAERLINNCTRFISALQARVSVKPQAPLMVQGSFLGIEQGDYAHWNMRAADGMERSFFILRPDSTVEKILENPENSVGKKCRVTWKESMEDIPEAGGKIKVQQILHVEWLDKK
jgi:hypothetical protein